MQTKHHCKLEQELVSISKDGSNHFKVPCVQGTNSTSTRTPASNVKMQSWSWSYAPPTHNYIITSVQVAAIEQVTQVNYSLDIKI